MRRRRTVIAALVVLVVVTGGAGLGLRWFKTSTAVSTEEALRRFHEQGKATPSPPQPSTEKSSSADRTSDRSAPQATRAAEQVPEATQTAPVFRPDPGVYSWKTEGFEEALGIRRRFPPESQRIVTVDGERRYSYHHFYSEEHQEWFAGRLTQSQVLVPYVRSRVVFGPFDGEIEVKFDPPMIFTYMPFEVGRAWRGQWSGDTYGEYSARVFERARTRVAGQYVEVWGVHLHFFMHGDVEGEQDLRAWIAPEHRTTVREQYVVTGRLKGKPGTYHGEWTISLLSLKPRR
jgi:hypothetical protein